MIIGYARCSTIQQNLDRQIDALKAAGCDRIFQEKASGKDTHGRPELAKALGYLNKDDIFIVAEWDRATRSMWDGLKIIQQIADRGALIKVLDKKDFDLTTPVGRGILSLLSALAEDDRLRINSRAAAGRKIAKAKGVKFGPKFKLDAVRREEARNLLAHRTMTDVAKMFGVSVSTISRLA